jgi:hypothetical protein
MDSYDKTHLGVQSVGVLLIYWRKTDAVQGNKCLFFSVAQQTLVGQGVLAVEVSRSHATHSVGRLWTSDYQPNAETSTC